MVMNWKVQRMVKAGEADPKVQYMQCTSTDTEIAASSMKQ